VIAVCAYPFAAVFVSKFGQVQGIGNVIIAYVLGLVAFCVLFVIQRTFYALGDTRTPFFFTLFQVVLVIIGVLACALLPSPWIAAGVALTVTVSGIAQTVLAAWLLRGRLAGIDGRRILRSLVTYFVAALPAIVVGVALLLALGGAQAAGYAVSGKIQAISSMLVIGLAMSAAYFGMLLVMRSDELRGFLSPVLARFRR
jgi:putative peptidoglycan lipid II flippase